MVTTYEPLDAEWISNLATVRTLQIRGLITPGHEWYNGATISYYC